MSKIEADSILPNQRIRQAVYDSEVTQLTRGAGTQYASKGDTFEIDGDLFEVTGVDQRTLGELTDADAQREGSESLEAYKQRMQQVHPGDFTWDDSDEVMSYRFERID